MSEDEQASGGLPSPGEEGGEISPSPAPKPPRQRHDGSAAAKQKKFFGALKKSGCIANACRVAGISRNTVRRHRDKWPDFDSRVEAALAIASVEPDTRVEPSDSMLRLLIEGARPGKYGRTGQMPKDAVMKKLRKEAEKEVRAKARASTEDLTAAILKNLAVIRRRRLAKGCTVGPDGTLVPPGWRMIADPDAPPPPEKDGG